MGNQTYDISEKPPLQQESAYKFCPNCCAMVLVFARFCPECGHEFSHVETDFEPDLDDLMLGEYLDPQTKYKVATLRRERKRAFEEELPPDLAIENFVNENGYTPPSQWLRGAILRKNASVKSKNKFLEYLDKTYNGSPKWQTRWVEYQLMLEFGTSDFSVIFNRDWRAALGVPYSADFEEVKQSYVSIINRFTASDLKLLEELNLALTDAQDELTID
jgi:hypothetical protein